MAGLTPEQQAAFAEVPVELLIRPSGDQTERQARTAAVSDFRAWCQLEGLEPVPSEEDVEAAIRAALSPR